MSIHSGQTILDCLEQLIQSRIKKKTRGIHHHYQQVINGYEAKIAELSKKIFSISCLFSESSAFSPAPEENHELRELELREQRDREQRDRDQREQVQREQEHREQEQRNCEQRDREQRDREQHEQEQRDREQRDRKQQEFERELREFYKFEEQHRDQLEQNHFLMIKTPYTDWEALFADQKEMQRLASNLELPPIDLNDLCDDSAEPVMQRKPAKKKPKNHRRYQRK